MTKNIFFFFVGNMLLFNVTTLSKKGKIVHTSLLLKRLTLCDVTKGTHTSPGAHPSDS